MTKIPEGKEFLEQRGEITLWKGDIQENGYTDYGMCFDFNGERFGCYTTIKSYNTLKVDDIQQVLKILTQNGKDSLAELKKTHG